MKKWVVFTGAFCCLIGVSISIAATKKAQPEESLKKFFPNLPYKSITKTEIEGLYEVMTDGRIIYFHPASGYLFAGEMINREGRSITRERYAEEKYKLLTQDDLKKAIKVGNGKNIVVEVTDPDCPFCRKMHAYWSMRSDITRYIYFNPLAMHPDSAKKVKYIFAAKDRVRAMFEVYCGSLDNKKDILNKEYDDKGMMAAQKVVVDKLQANATPSYWINGKFVSGANIPLIEKIIGKAAKANSGATGGSITSCEDIK